MIIDEKEIKAYKSSFESTPPEGLDGLDLMLWLKRKDMRLNIIAHGVMLEAIKELEDE